MNARDEVARYESCPLAVAAHPPQLGADGKDEPSAPACPPGYAWTACEVSGHSGATHACVRDRGLIRAETTFAGFNGRTQMLRLQR